MRGHDFEYPKAKPDAFTCSVCRMPFPNAFALWSHSRHCGKKGKHAK